jgi:hypothetical protein
MKGRGAEFLLSTPTLTLPHPSWSLHILGTGGMKISHNNGKLSPPHLMGEGEGGGGQNGLLSPSPQSPPIEGGEGNKLKTNWIFTIEVHNIVKIYYRTPCVKCVLRPAHPRGRGLD